MTKKIDRRAITALKDRIEKSSSMSLSITKRIETERMTKAERERKLDDAGWEAGFADGIRYAMAKLQIS